MTMKKEKWTEDEILALPKGEHNYFERKGAGILTDSGFQEKLAKVLCALANSHGGHFIMGVENDGTITGVPQAHVGRQPTREWIEQLISLQLVPVLQDFKVHEVVPNNSSLIPTDRVIIVIDVYDSNLAPHQTQKTNQYYYRGGGHSISAPHLYLEGLRNRQTFPSERVVEVWFKTVLNPLIEFLTLTKETLEKREWRFYKGDDPDDDYISLGYIHRDHKRTFQHEQPLQRLRAENKEHFLEYYQDISKAGVEYDDSVRKLSKTYHELFSNLSSNPILKTLFFSLATLDNILSLIKDKALSKKFSKDFQATFEEEFPQSKIFKDLALYTLNRESLESGNFLHQKIWNQNRLKFLELLNDDSVKTIWENIGEIEKDVLNKTETLLNLLKTKRKMLSEKHGVPFYI